MKKYFVLIISFSLVLAACSAPVPSETTTPDPDPFRIPWADRSIYKSGLVAAEQSVLEGLEGASVYHIELEIASDLYHVTGHQEVHYTNKEAEALSEIEFRLFPNTLGGSMEVTNLLANGESVTPDYDLNNSLLILPLPAPLVPGQSLVIGMDFKVTVPQSVELNYGVLAYYEDVLALAHAYPMIAVHDDEGWNAEIPPQFGDVTYADASFYLVKVTAPSGVTLVSTGNEISSVEGGRTQTVTVASGPARDFFLTASPNYEVNTEKVGEVTIRSFAPIEDAEGARQALATASQAIQKFSSRYEPYPYTEFDIVSTPTRALGIEYPGMIAIASRIFAIDQDIGGVPASIYLEATVTHEAGHQWFYNLVGDDQLDDPWLDESLTQFATLQYYEDRYGPQGAAGFQQSLEGRWAGVNYEQIPIGMPVAAYDGQEYSAIVYGRGPLFFVALRDEMGVDIFDAFLKDYTEQLAWNIATPEILQSLAEKHCSCDLDAIFNEWVYSQ